jgi:hypothetical protein
LWNIFFKFEKGKRKNCEDGFVFNDFDQVSMNSAGVKIQRIMRQLLRLTILPGKCYNETNVEVLRMLFSVLSVYDTNQQ